MVTWVRVDDEMPQHAVLSGPNLFINNLNKTDNGTYRCEASNTVGKAHSDYMLYVYGTWENTPLLLLDSLTCSCSWGFTPKAEDQIPIDFLQELKRSLWPAPLAPPGTAVTPSLDFPPGHSLWACWVGKLCPQAQAMKIMLEIMAEIFSHID